MIVEVFSKTTQATPKLVIAVSQKRLREYDKVARLAATHFGSGATFQNSGNVAFYRTLMDSDPDTAGR